jgi:DNA repair exonuclease SbcCD ATPase subunit
MSEQSLLKKCPICDADNYMSSVTDDKVISCRNCRAPIYNADRPSNDVDLKRYQEMIIEWGSEYRKTFSANIQAKASNHQASNHRENQEKQVENAELRKQLVGLQNQIKAQEIRHHALKEKHTSELSEQSNQFQTEIEAQKAKFQQLQASYQSELGKQRETLQAEIEAQKNQYQQLQASYQSELGKQRETLQAEIGAQKNQYEQLQSSHKSELARQHAEMEDVKNAYESLEKKHALLLSNLYTLVKNFSDDSDAIDSLLSETISSRVPANVRDENSEREANQPVDKIRASNRVAEKEIGNESTQNSLESESSLGSPPNTLAIAPQVPAVIPSWMEEYRNLSQSTARLFREALEKENSIAKFMVPQDSLEHQRVSIDDTSPIFTEGPGSYWRILDSSNDIYFLVLNKERFVFNSSNYQSITVCYDFNSFDQSTLKNFKSSDYELNSYEIVYPAQVVPIPNTDTWQLSSRGRLIFKPKPPE